MDLNTIWYLLIGVLITGYAILDGFDLGVGALSLFAHGNRERRIHINAIGPVWDGNEVWLLTGGGGVIRRIPYCVCDRVQRILSRVYAFALRVDCPGGVA